MKSTEMIYAGEMEDLIRDYHPDMFVYCPKCDDGTLSVKDERGFHRCDLCQAYEKVASVIGMTPQP